MQGQGGPWRRDAMRGRPGGPGEAGARPWGVTGVLGPAVRTWKPGYNAFCLPGLPKHSPQMGRPWDKRSWLSQSRRREAEVKVRRGRVASEAVGAPLLLPGAAGGLGPPWLAAAASPGLCSAHMAFSPREGPSTPVRPALSVLASERPSFQTRPHPWAPGLGRGPPLWDWSQQDCEAWGLCITGGYN